MAAALLRAAAIGKSTQKQYYWVVLVQKGDGIFGSHLWGSCRCNYFWELAQAPLYIGPEDFRTTLWHCFVASLGDGLMVLGIVADGGVILRRPAWFVRPGVQGAIVMVALGLMFGVTVEWVAVHVLQRWAYTAQMPRLPGLDVRLVPVAQMLVLPPLILWVVARWQGGIANTSTAKNTARRGRNPPCEGSPCV